MSWNFQLTIFSIRKLWPRILSFPIKNKIYIVLSESRFMFFSFLLKKAYSCHQYLIFFSSIKTHNMI
jgi:hypothetical protein